MERAAHNGFINIDVTIPDFQVEAAIRVGANPSFVMNSCPLTAKVRQGHQVSSLALLAFGEIIGLLHEVHLPTEFKFSVVYTKRWLLTRAYRVNTTSPLALSKEI